MVNEVNAPVLAVAAADIAPAVAERDAEGGKGEPIKIAGKVITASRPINKDPPVAAAELVCWTS